MPYNYPMLLPLLQNLIQDYRLKPPNEWRAQFGIYMSTVPPYYIGPLKRALLRIGASNLAATINEESYLSYSVLNYLKKLKTQAKVEYERTCAEVGSRVQSKEGLISSSVKRINLFKNPYDVPRDQLLDHLCKLRSHFFRPSAYLQGSESLHNQPVAQMGNYQEYLKRMPTPLREIESTPVRQHMFGNPFKIDKRIVIDKIDEADFDPIVGSGGEDGSATPTRKPKRKPGPLPKGYHFIPNKNRLPYAPSEVYEESPTPSPASSPSSSPMYESESEDISANIFLPIPHPVTPISGSSSLSLDIHVQESENVVESETLHFPGNERLVPLENGSATLEELEMQDLEERPPVRREPVDDFASESAMQQRLEDEERIWKKNIQIRTELHKEIRRPIIRKYHAFAF